MNFSYVAEIFNQIELVSSRLEITKHLATLLGKATAYEASIICNLSLGLLHPPYVGTQFNVAEKSLIKSVAQISQQTIHDVEAELKQTGDLGSVLQKYKTFMGSSISVTQVYDALSEIEQTVGAGSQEKKATLFEQLCMKLDAESAKYVVRIMLGKLRLGFSDMTIIDALSWMEAGDKSLHKEIEHAYSVCADIGLIAQRIKEQGLDAIRKMHIHVGIPIRPAGAERLPTPQAIIDKIGPCVAQPKLDGFRLQVHVDTRSSERVIRFFSRNLQDMSNMFPELKKAFASLKNVQSLVCEGEAIGYDPETNTFLPFQETVKRKRKHDVEQAAAELPLQFFMFDIMYLNGTNLMEKIHEDRLKAMKQLLADQVDADTHVRDVIRIIDEKWISTAQELEAYFYEIVSEGLEGLVVKKPDSTYQPGKRNFNWIKLKRVEEGHLEDTIDCVVLGYYAGKGKRALFGIGAFLVGIYNKKNDSFETVAKIGTGLKDHEWKELKQRCDAVKAEDKPHNVICPKELYPDQWVYPEIVCVVRADEITRSPLHTTGKTTISLGYALRFPRFIDYRMDKGPYEATHTAELIHMYEDQYKK